jgi:hypothetical protein
MTLIAPIYLPYYVLIDCCMPTCTCTHAKLSKTSFFLGQILNHKMSFVLGRREYVVHRGYVASVRSGSTSTTSCTTTTRLRPQRLYINDVVCYEYLSLGHSGSTSTTSRGSSSTSSSMPRVRVPRLVTRLVADYFTYAARPVAPCYLVDHFSTYISMPYES